MSLYVLTRVGTLILLVYWDESEFLAHVLDTVFGRASLLSLPLSDMAASALEEMKTMLLTVEMCADALMLYSHRFLKGRVQFLSPLTPSPLSNPPPPPCWV